MTYTSFNSTGISGAMTYLNSTTNGLGIPLIMNLAVLPIFLIILISVGGVKRGLVGSFFICAVLSSFLWSADLIGTIWPFLYFIACGVALAFPSDQ